MLGDPQIPLKYRFAVVLYSAVHHTLTPVHSQASVQVPVGDGSGLAHTIRVAGSTFSLGNETYTITNTFANPTLSSAGQSSFFRTMM